MYNLNDLCKFLVKATQNERKSSKFATEKRYPDAGKCQRKIKAATLTQQSADEK